jgi:hypothetical protein
MALLDARLAGSAMLAQPLGHPLLDASLRVLDESGLGGAADDAFERHARRWGHIGTAVEEVAIAGVAQN